MSTEWLVSAMLVYSAAVTGASLGGDKTSCCWMIAAAADGGKTSFLTMSPSSLLSLRSFLAGCVGDSSLFD